MDAPSVSRTVAPALDAPDQNLEICERAMKIALVGSVGVGKSTFLSAWKLRAKTKSIAGRLASSTFIDGGAPNTAAANTSARTLIVTTVEDFRYGLNRWKGLVCVDNVWICVELVEVRANSMSLISEEVDAFILMFSFDSLKSFDAVTECLHQMVDHNKHPGALLVFGNKLDTDDQDVMVFHTDMWKLQRCGASFSYYQGSAYDDKSLHLFDDAIRRAKKSALPDGRIATEDQYSPTCTFPLKYVWSMAVSYARRMV